MYSTIIQNILPANDCHFPHFGNVIVMLIPRNMICKSTSRVIMMEIVVIKTCLVKRLSRAFNMTINLSAIFEVQLTFLFFHRLGKC